MLVERVGLSCYTETGRQAAGTAKAEPGTPANTRTSSQHSHASRVQPCKATQEQTTSMPTATHHSHHTNASSRAKPRNPAHTPHRRPAPYDPTVTPNPTTPKPCRTRPRGPRERPTETEHPWPRAGPPAGPAPAPSAQQQTRRGAPECSPADPNPGTGPGGNQNPHPAAPAYLTPCHVRPPPCRRTHLTLHPPAAQRQISPVYDSNSSVG